jgi:hypothetical protein
MSESGSGAGLARLSWGMSVFSRCVMRWSITAKVGIELVKRIEIVVA